MGFYRLGMVAVALAAAALVLPGCSSMGAGVGVNVGRGPVYRHGPPDHAPAHGHRMKHRQHGVDMVYDSGLGVYVLAGATDLYFHNDLFLRFGGDGWEVSASLDGPWGHDDGGKVPSGLKKHKQQAKAKGPGKSKGKGNKKGRGKS